MASVVSAAQKDGYGRDGYVLVRGFLDPDQAATLLAVARGDRAMRDHAYDREDTAGGRTRLSLWYEPGDDVYGRLCRSERIVDTLEDLLGQPVYHFHSKLMQKEPKVGGAWEWHQDYGYWYDNGFLRPDMASCYIALDAATRVNGCLQVIAGSHLLGRIDHGKVAGQVGADQARVDAILEHMPLTHCEMAPGDALFFHANLLHRSDQNRSDHPRWSMISCFSTVANGSILDDRRFAFRPLHKVQDGHVFVGPMEAADDVVFNDGGHHAANPSTRKTA